MDDKYIELEKQYGALFLAQLEIEEGFKQLASTSKAQMYFKAKQEGTASETALGSSLIAHEIGSAVEAIKVFMEHTVKPKPGVKPSYYEIVNQLSEIYEGQHSTLYELLTFAAFSTILNGVFKKESFISNLALQISTTVQYEAKLEAFLKAFPDEKYINDGLKKRVGVSYKLYYARHYMNNSGFTWYEWGKQEKLHFGGQLIEILKESTRCFEDVSVIDRKGNNTLEILPTQWLLKTWATNEENIIERAFKLCPSVIPPFKWENFTTGGYYGKLQEHSKLLRLTDIGSNTFAKEYMQRLNQVELTDVLTAINSIQETPWKINKKILEVVQAVKRRGGEIGGFARLEPYPELPKLPEPYTEDELKKHKKQAIIFHLKEHRRKSLALRALSHLDLAEKFAEYERLYFPCNMDFRGRIYPMSPFSFQGDDINKALLLFADAPPCNSMEDIDYLMLQGASLAGVDKVSFDARKRWIVEHEKQILNSAADPLGFLWWSEQDSPYQFLSFCFEWQAWKQWQAKHKTPKGFITGLPIAFDGTCSGLQHFSAIMRDTVGGKAVNLIPSDKPQDIYGIVAEKVVKILEKDAVKGTLDEEKEAKKTGNIYLKLGTRTLAQQWLSYGVDRKVTKRSCMTLAYGSKEYGFSEQIMEDILKPAKLEGKGEMFSNDFQAAKYMAKLIWEAVQTTVVKAVEGMKWLQQMATIACQGSKVVTWVTPMGLPIQQSYMEVETKKYQLRFGGTIQHRLYSCDFTGNIDKRAQAQGIAPNFIHSMDAAHLQLTVIMAKKEGIKHFSMIHDSYAAPAAQAGLMFKTVRNAFVKMYTENNVFETFKENIAMQLKQEVILPDIPEKGSLDLEQVRTSLYTFH